LIFESFIQKTKHFIENRKTNQESTFQKRIETVILCLTKQNDDLQRHSKKDF
jgi:hypothetical protein